MKTVDVYLAALFRRYTLYVAEHPLPFLITPIVISLLLSTGMWFRFEEIRDADYLFAARDAPYKSERKIITSYWANSDENFHPAKDSGMLQRKGAYVLIVARDGGSVLRSVFAREFMQFMQYAHHNISFKSDNQVLTYKDVCLRWRGGACFTNPHASFIADLFMNNDQKLIPVTYPIFQSPTQNAEVHLSDTLGGVTLDAANGHVVAAQAWLLMYPLMSDDSAKELSSQWEIALGDVIENDQKNDMGFFANRRWLSYSHFHSQTLQEELNKDSMQVKPRFALAFVVLFGFSIICTIRLRRFESIGTSLPVVDWCTSKPVLALMALISAALAVVSAKGGLCWLGMPYADIVNVMPFIAVSIGVDDMFLILAAWRNSEGEPDVNARLGECISHAAVSITITSVTDALSFAVGTMAPLPAVTIFCTYASVAVVLTFIYTITFFLAIFVYQARAEMAGSHCCAPFIETQHIYTLVDRQPSLGAMLFNLGVHPGCSQASVQVPKHSPSVTTVSTVVPPSVTTNEAMTRTNSTASTWSRSNGSLTQCDHSSITTGSASSLQSKVINSATSRGGVSHFFENIYAPVICHPLVSIGSLLILVAYLIVAIQSAQHVKIGFELKNLLFHGSSAYKFTEHRERYFSDGTNRVDIIVQRPPPLWRSDERNAFIDMVHALETTQYSAGRASTHFWLFAYIRKLRSIVFTDNLAINTQEEFFLHLREFMKNDEYFAYDIRMSASASDIDAFRFSIGLKNIADNTDKVRASNVIRETCAEYPQYNLTSFSMLFPLADQFALMVPQTVQNIAIALVCVVVVSLLLIPVPLCSLVVALTVVSIDIGVIGYMTMWNVNLDCISMITLAMSVGFSVDFAAHITYGPTPTERVGFALGHLGVPLIQAATTTILGVLVLITIDTYIVQTCVKTVVLVIAFGTCHALLFLPVLLSMCDTLWHHMVRPVINLVLNNNDSTSITNSQSIANNVPLATEHHKHSYNPKSSHRTLDDISSKSSLSFSHFGDNKIQPTSVSPATTGNFDCTDNIS